MTNPYDAIQRVYETIKSKLMVFVGNVSLIEGFRVGRENAAMEVLLYVPTLKHYSIALVMNQSNARRYLVIVRVSRVNPLAVITNSIFNTQFDLFYLNRSISSAKFGPQSFFLPNKF